MPEGLINVNGENVQALEIIFLMTAITLLPSLVVMMTSFSRFIISFSFLRNAMGHAADAAQPCTGGSRAVFDVFYHVPYHHPHSGGGL